MNILRLINLIMAIILVLVSLTASWLICDTYNKYGWIYEVTTIIKGENKTQVETVANYIGITTVLWFLSLVSFANYFSLSKLRKKAAPTNDRK